MLKQIKNLTVKMIGLGLILLSHVGLLSLTFGDYWIKSFYYQYKTSILASVLILIVIYAVSFSLFRAPRKRIHTITLYLVVIVGSASLIYATFFATPNTLKIVASSFLFIGVSFLIAWCAANYEKIIWKTIQGITITALLLFCLNLLYIHQNFYSNLMLRDQGILNTGDEKKFNKKESEIRSAFYNIHLTEYYLSDYRIPARLSNIPSYISAFDNKNFLLIDRFGNIYHLALRQNSNNDENLYIRKLPATFPINYQSLYSSDAGTKITKSLFRVNDLFIDTENGQKVLYVSHHFWNNEKECISLKLSKLVGDVSLLLADNISPQWRVLYETSPCISIIPPEYKFGGHQAGGRIVGLDADHLLLSVGDHGPLFFSQDINSSYGKIWKINRDNGAAKLISIGHRNPQGLYRAHDGAIWETEHGPQSGDELNKIKTGKNYGWPYALYGTDYGRFIWPSGSKQNHHEGYEQPIFVWTPAIAVSNLIGVEKDLFPLWRHNLLVGSLKEKTLFRLQMYADRVIYSEPIKLNQRIRDLIETPNGEIFIWSDRQNLIRLRPESSGLRKNETLARAGKRLFYQCVGCHSIIPNGTHNIGPNLNNIYKNKIARYDDFNYSPALRNRSTERWTSENLDLFLKDPQIFAPGTSMQMKIPDDYERQALIDYLMRN